MGEGRSLEIGAADSQARRVSSSALRFRPCGNSRAVRAAHRLIEQVAPFDTNVLILGESGTGKEMAARHIHELSLRAGQSFVPVNCGAIPAELLESELFGHEKGAFTGALSTRLGRFEFAEGGTLFLDEIGDMSVQMQVKLLRVLQERSFERVGSNRTIRCDVRIIAATHRNLEAAIRDGAFREDLFYRLNVFPLQMPPLRERLEDLPTLIAHLAERQALATGRPIRLSPEAMRCLRANPWRGQCAGAREFARAPRDSLSRPDDPRRGFARALPQFGGEGEQRRGAQRRGARAVAGRSGRAGHGHNRGVPRRRVAARRTGLARSPLGDRDRLDSPGSRRGRRHRGRGGPLVAHAPHNPRREAAQIPHRRLTGI